MKKFNLKKSVLLIVAFFAVSTVSAQGLANLRINEVMVSNTNSVTDSHGERVGWIELYNSGFTTINLAGCFISVAPDAVNVNGEETVDREVGGLTYRFPKSAQYRLDLVPQAYLLIYCGGNSNYGPFNTTFTLDKTDVITVWDASGKGIPLAHMSYDLGQQLDNVSLERIETENGDIYSLDTTPTPGHANFNEDGESKGEIVKAQDPSGIGMTIIAILVVFSALLILYLIFRTTGKVMQRLNAPKVVKTVSATSPKSEPVSGDMNGEIAAAIAYALKAYQDQLEAAEEMALTMNMVAKVYSPWSSKIHGLTREPGRRK